MKPWVIYLLVACAGLAIGVGSARAGSIGVGAFAGTSVPIVQADQGNGSIYGLRIPIKLVPAFTVEPFYSSSALGNKTIDIAPGITTTFEGSDVTTYGINALLTLGGPVSFYPFAGIGQATFKRTGQDESFTSYSFGFGLGLSPAPKLTIDFRAEVQAAVEGDVSRKMGNFTLGASYALFNLP
jgi:hypothetical protein